MNSKIDSVQHVIKAWGKIPISKINFKLCLEWGLSLDLLCKVCVCILPLFVSSVQNSMWPCVHRVFTP